MDPLVPSPPEENPFERLANRMGGGYLLKIHRARRLFLFVVEEGEGGPEDCIGSRNKIISRTVDRVFIQ